METLGKEYLNPLLNNKHQLALPDEPQIKWPDTRLDSVHISSILNSCTSFVQITNDILSPSEVATFQNVLLSTLPREIHEYVKNINREDIAKIISAIVLIALLVTAGVAVAPAVAVVGARIGLTAVFVRFISMGITRPGTVSAIMGVIPGMKMFAPNQSIALTTNFFKDLFLYILPGTISKLKSQKE